MLHESSRLSFHLEKGGRNNPFRSPTAMNISATNTGKDVKKMTIAFSVIGILLAFGALIFAAYKKISMFLAAVLAAAIYRQEDQRAEGTHADSGF